MDTRHAEDETNDLVREHLDLVGRTVAKVSARYPRHVDREELWNAGALGLVEAARRYNPDSGIPFERFAAIRIRGAIIDSTRTRDWASRSVRRRYREVEEATSALRDETGRDPDRDHACQGDRRHHFGAREDSGAIGRLHVALPRSPASRRDRFAP